MEYVDISPLRLTRKEIHKKDREEKEIIPYHAFHYFAQRKKVKMII